MQGGGGGGPGSATGYHSESYHFCMDMCFMHACSVYITVILFADDEHEVDGRVSIIIAIVQYFLFNVV